MATVTGAPDAVRPETPESSKHGLVRALGLRDLVLLNVVAVFNLNLVPPVAAGGYPALLFWLVGLLLFFLPQGMAVAEFATRYPDEGGIYIWTKKSFGEFHGFLCGWCYWTTNVFYIPTLLVYLVGILLFEGGGRAQTAGEDPLLQISASLVLLWGFTLLSIRGLGVNKWINNAGGVAAIFTALALGAIGILVFARHGVAEIPAASKLLPTMEGWRDLSAFGVILLALVGLELGAVMGDEIRDPRRDIPRAAIWGGVAAGALYLASTLILLLALPVKEISVVNGVLQAMEKIGGRVGLAWLHRMIAVVLGISICGAISAWLSGGARIPFVAGLDRYLPAWLGRVHPRWHTPHLALGAQAVASSLAILLSFAGTKTRVRDAYDILLALTIVTQLVPFLYLFASLVHVAGTAGGYLRSRSSFLLAGAAGLISTAAAMVTAFIPPQGVEKIRSFEVKLGIGTLFFIGIAALVFYGRRSRRAG